ncbi:MAG: RHS repeat protein [Kiritimatiellae bacterium]|nr:RHS repeat protein [Kiritimatiellia bacterium]
MKANPPAALLLALALAALGASPAFAQSLPESAAYLPMGAYTNDFSAPMPDWWFEDMSGFFYDPDLAEYADLSPIVYSNDYATATVGQVHQFAFHAVHHFDFAFWMYDWMLRRSPYSDDPYFMAEFFFRSGDGSDASVDAAVFHSSFFWNKIAAMGGAESPPWDAPLFGQFWDQPINIGQLKNAFAFFLIDDDFDSILDDYEYREFGSLDVAHGPFDDPGGNGLSLFVSQLAGLDPLAPPAPFAISNQTAEVALFPALTGRAFSGGEPLYERTFAISRADAWQQYFIVRSDATAAQRIQILYSDGIGDFHNVAAAFAEGETALAVRLEHVSPCQESLTIRIIFADDEDVTVAAGHYSCPSLSLACWVPKVEFLGLREIQANGRTYHVAPPGGTDGLVASFSVDWSGIPDGSNPTNWPETYGEDLPLNALDGLAVESIWDEPSRLLSGGAIRPAGAGAFSLDALSALPSPVPPDPLQPGADDALLFLAPGLSWPGSRSRCGSWIDYDPVTGTYTNASAYPLDSASLLENWHFLEDRECNHAPKPTLDLGDPGLTDLVDTSVELVSDDPPTACATVSLGGKTLWSDEISHFCAGADDSPCHSETPLSDPDCDCEGSETDGDSFGSCAFRLALGFPLLDTVSGFLWFRSEEIPTATPSMLSLLVREGAAVTCQSNHPGGAISHVRCLDPRGRDITVAPISDGLRLVVSNAACTFLDHYWEITNPGGNPSQLNIRKISRLGNPLSDHTYERGDVPAPDAIFAEDSRLWRRTDNLTGLVETRIVSDGLNAPRCRARWIEEIKADAASGALYAYSQSRSALLGKGDRAVLRETNRVERTFDPAHPRETFATYWENPTNRLLHGKARLTWGDRPWSYRAYDALGRETLSLSQLDGSPCPVGELESLRPATLAEALAAIPPATAFAAAVSDYAPLAGDSADDRDAALPRTVSEYEVRTGTLFPAAKTWTVYNREGFDDEWEFPLLSVRTERAATPSAAFGDPGNAVSTEVSFDIRDGRDRRHYAVFDGMPVASTNEDGQAVFHDNWFGSQSFFPGGARVTLSGKFLHTEKDLPLPGRAPDPMRPQRIRILDRERGTELFAGSFLRVGNQNRHFDYRYNLYDDQDRLRATFFPDGSSTTNAYSCCRLLWSQDRDGRRTVRSAVTGEDMLYYANLETSLGEIPAHDYFGPYADRDWWTSQDATSYRITQHFMDASGRETNTVTGVLKKEGSHHPETRSFINSNPNAWRSNATVAYPDGVSGHAVSTDARGLATESFFRDFPDRTESVTVSYPRGDSAHPFTTNTVVSFRNGARVSERRWDGGWTRTTETAWRDALGRRTALSVTEASDLDGPVTNSLSVSDFLGRTILAETPLSSVTYAYDGATSRVVSETDAKSGLTTLHHYDAYGDPVGSTRLGVTSLTTTTHVLDNGELWRVTTSVVSNGDVTASSTEMRERLTGLSDALRSETVSLADGATNAVTRSAFDSADEILTATTVSPTRGTNVVERRLGATVSMCGASGETRYYYDPYGRHYFTERSIPGDSKRYRIARTEFNAAGDITCEDVFYIANLNFSSTYHGYDCRGNRIATTNALGGVERRAYDALGRPVAVWGSAARPTLYGYDTQGRRTSLSTTRDPAADALLSTLQPFNPSTWRTALPWDTTQWRYDPATGLCLNKVYSDGSTVTNTYTPDGLLASRLNAARFPETRTYDANRRLASVSCGDVMTYEYDAFGNCVRSVGADTELCFSRNERGAITNEFYEWPGVAVATAYDDYGRIVSRSAGGVTTRYAYAPDGLLATVSNGAFRVDYLYTADRLDAGYVVTTAGGVEIARHVTRDTWRRHLVTVVSNSVTPIFHSPFSIRHSYSYDALGRPVSRSGDDFGYNARSEVAWTTIGNIDAEYAYDPAGNRTVSSWDEDASTYTATGLNQYEAIITGGVTNALVHDAWGNLTGTRPFRFTYSYAGNLLVGVGTNRVNGVRAYADYDYDAQLRRAYKYVHPSSGQSQSRWYFHSGWSLMQERWQQGDSGPYNFVHYVWGRDLSGTLDGAGGVGGLLATEVGGVWYFPLYDNNGNVTDYVSETGEVVASYAYDAFGRTIAQSGAMASVFPFRFSTKYYDAEADLYYYGYRYYSPEMGRWLTRDPIEEDGGDNLYAFCGNNGVNRVDPTGKFSINLYWRELTTEEKRNIKQLATEIAHKCDSLLASISSFYLNEFHQAIPAPDVGWVQPREIDRSTDVNKLDSNLVEVFMLKEHRNQGSLNWALTQLKWRLVAEKKIAQYDSYRMSTCRNVLCHLGIEALKTPLFIGFCKNQWEQEDKGTQRALVAHEASHMFHSTLDLYYLDDGNPLTPFNRLRDAYAWGFLFAY